MGTRAEGDVGRSVHAAMRRPMGRGPDGVLDLTELVRMGSLAASSHNSQPWLFRIVDDSMIELRPDFTRRCPIADPHDAHLFQSLGCAIENIVQAARGLGVRVDVEIDADGAPADEVIRLGVHQDPGVEPSRLTSAIVDRRCSRVRYDGRPARPDPLRTLEAAATGPGIRPVVLTDPGRVRMAAQFVERGTADQFSDPAFRNELIDWIRPNDRIARATGDGLWTRATGAPSLPTPLARLALRLALRPRSQITRHTEDIESSAGLVVIVSTGDEPHSWVEAGRSTERVLLAATVEGLRTAFVNQPIEVGWLRPEFERWLGLDGEHAQLMIRFGTGPSSPLSLRRPVGDVLEATGDEFGDRMGS